MSGYEYIQVGVSNVPFGPHSWNNAGIGISNFPLLGTSAKVDFEGLTDGLTGPIYHLDFPITEAPETHDELGIFSFAQAGDGDVWFGEWSENGETVVDGTTYNGRQVYYHGDDADSNVTTNNLLGSVVDYNVTGINKYTENGVMQGTFTADFGTLELTGYVQNTTSNIKLDIGTADIGLNTAAVSGNGAVFSVSGVDVATGGTVNGHFFNNQDALAGIANFGAGSDYNTAFGGQAQ
ncbi:Slam-dependent surface lipoprotein [Nitrincola sp. A-D6]|uniref:Slam-dependent surface lipoprotein n=1 Tax=Nitrincola sp. A-D6 TaxID=1545442 RepID=UPI00068D22DF|nr:Slam-dependent surface lipoprotein [Nitrincola sp. A-D6]